MAAAPNHAKEKAKLVKKIGELEAGVRFLKERVDSFNAELRDAVHFDQEMSKGVMQIIASTKGLLAKEEAKLASAQSKLNILEAAHGAGRRRKTRRRGGSGTTRRGY